MIKVCASYSNQEEKQRLLKEMESLKHFKVTKWPKKEYPSKGKSPGTKIYLELSTK